MELVYFHLVAILITTPIDEINNLNNPSINPSREYILCNWNSNDFYRFEDQSILKTYGKDDGFFKKKARNKYNNK